MAAAAGAPFDTGEIRVGTRAVRTWLAVPLAASDVLVGVLELGSERAGAFIPNDVRLAQIIATQAAAAIQNAHLYEEVQQRLQQTEALRVISQSISNTLDLDGVLDLVVRSAAQTIPVATHSVLYLLDLTGEDFVPGARFVRHHRPAPPELEAAREKAIQDAVRRQAPVHITCGLWSLMIAPLKIGQAVIGAICVESPSVNAFSSGDEELLNTFASHASIAIQNANLFRDLSSAYVDLARQQEEILSSHKTLQALFNGITDGLYIVDRDQRIVAINQAEAKRLGKTPELLVGQPCDVALWGEAGSVVAKIVLDTFETGEEGNWESQKDAVGRGPFAERDVRTYPILGTEGEVSQVIVFAQDVSEKRQLQASLFRSASLAAVGQLASNIAHQINNPLTVVIANSQIIQMGADPASLDYRATKDMVEAGVRIQGIVQSLLDFSNQENYNWFEVDIQATLDDALSFVVQSLRRSNIDVVKRIADLPLMIASASHLKLVWMNLLLNARDAISARLHEGDRSREVASAGELGEPAAGTIEIRAGQPDPDCVQVQIIDDGIGISPRHRDHLFHPFFTTKAPGKGLGLGLYTCRTIVERHQGKIEIGSAQGEAGTVVTVTLPVLIAPPPDA
jgi:two-component system NtrC family sensor kinase